MWERLGYEPSVALVPWRKADPALLVEESVTAIVQVDGKVRDRLEVSPKISADELEALARASEAVVAIDRRARDRERHRARAAPREHRHPGLRPDRAEFARRHSSSTAVVAAHRSTGSLTDPVGDPGRA